MLCNGCAKKPQGAPPPAPDRPSQAAQRPQLPDAAAGPALQGKPEALPPLTPFADGKRLRIKPLEDGIEALEITVPAKFKLKYEGGEELAPSAHLAGQGLEVMVGPPEAGIFSLAQEKRAILSSDPAATFHRAEETEDGYLLIDLNNITAGGSDRRYDVAVTRPKLKVECWANALERLSDAELAASICLTLRAAPPKTRN